MSHAHLPPHISGHSLLSTASPSVCRMETFPAVAEEVLREFQVLLQHSPPPIGSTRMLQLVAINMFAVYNSQPKGTTCCWWGNWMGISHSPSGEGWGTPDGEVGVVLGCLWVSTQRDLGRALGAGWGV